MVICGSLFRRHRQVSVEISLTAKISADNALAPRNRPGSTVKLQRLSVAVTRTVKRSLVQAVDWQTSYGTATDKPVVRARVHA